MYELSRSALCALGYAYELPAATVSIRINPYHIVHIVQFQVSFQELSPPLVARCARPAAVAETAHKARLANDIERPQQSI